ncbi:MAG: hypothetical protein JW774_10860 [Candidatus Aureabacteria bacterium]|nr:hypothetical protein [Candidatus Auribacterota bacterium]
MKIRHIISTVVLLMALLLPLQAKTGVEEIPYSKGRIHIRYEYIQVNNRKIPHGVFKEFYPNGMLMKELHYDKGLLNGKATQYYPDQKKKWQGHFTGNLKTGKWIFWDSSGKKLIEGLFASNGGLLSITRYNKKLKRYITESMEGRKSVEPKAPPEPHNSDDYPSFPDTNEVMASGNESLTN